MIQNWLVIETSGRVGKVGLARGGAVVQTTELDATRRHARDLASTVQALLAAESLRPGDLTGVMVSVGPGSYTGLRVGVISAKALAYALECQLVAVPTFAAISHQAPAPARRIWVIADALQGQIYIQRYQRDIDGELPEPVDSLQIRRADETLIHAAPDVWFTGPGVKLHAAGLIPRECERVPEVDREPTVAGLFAVGMRLPPLTREELFRLEPLYLRGSSAEEKAARTPSTGPAAGASG